MLPILVVEDDPDIRESLEHVLELEGHSVVTAANGREGLEKLRALGSRCVVLLDLMMPVMNGEQFLAALGADARLAQNPVVVMTAYTQHPPGLRGVTAVMQKPMDLGALLQLLSRLMPPDPSSPQVGGAAPVSA